MFGWCLTNNHSECKREFQVYYVDKKGLVFTDQMVYCQCPKRGCKCYVKKADRKKAVKRK